MARYKEKSQAIKLRKRGYSYTQIKEKLGVSKSTLSGWLANYPLSDKRIRELRDNNPRRIEKYIATMRAKKNKKLDASFEKVGLDIGEIKERELFIAGFFLYWAEGGKTNQGALVFSNTDPSMVKTYLKWLSLLKISKEKIKIKLHLYKDMNEKKEIFYWSSILSVQESQFRKTWVKDSRMSDLNYKNNFGHGTCNVIINDTVLTTYVLMGIKFIANVMNA